MQDAPFAAKKKMEDGTRRCVLTQQRLHAVLFRKEQRFLAQNGEEYGR